MTRHRARTPSRSSDSAGISLTTPPGSPTTRRVHGVVPDFDGYEPQLTRIPAIRDGQFEQERPVVAQRVVDGVVVEGPPYLMRPSSSTATALNTWALWPWTTLTPRFSSQRPTSRRWSNTSVVISGPQCNEATSRSGSAASASLTVVSSVACSVGSLRSSAVRATPGLSGPAAYSGVVSVAKQNATAKPSVVHRVCEKTRRSSDRLQLGSFERSDRSTRVRMDHRRRFAQ